MLLSKDQDTDYQLSENRNTIKQSLHHIHCNLIFGASEGTSRFGRTFQSSLRTFFGQLDAWRYQIEVLINKMLEVIFCFVLYLSNYYYLQYKIFYKIRVCMCFCCVYVYGKTYYRKVFLDSNFLLPYFVLQTYQLVEVGLNPDTRFEEIENGEKWR